MLEKMNKVRWYGNSLKLNSNDIEQWFLTGGATCDPNGASINFHGGSPYASYNIENLIIKFTNKCICFYCVLKGRGAWNNGLLKRGWWKKVKNHWFRAWSFLHIRGMMFLITVIYFRYCVLWTRRGLHPMRDIQKVDWKMVNIALHAQRKIQSLPVISETLKNIYVLLLFHWLFIQNRHQKIFKALRLRRQEGLTFQKW